MISDKSFNRARIGTTKILPCSTAHERGACNYNQPLRPCLVRPSSDNRRSSYRKGCSINGGVMSHWSNFIFENFYFYFSIAKQLKCSKLNLADRFGALLNSMSTHHQSSYPSMSTYPRGITVRKHPSLLCVALLIGSMQPVFAGVTLGNSVSSAIPAASADIQTVAVRCGPGTFENHRGVCRPVSERRAYSNRACPPGYHLGPHRKWCWPN